MYSHLQRAPVQNVGVGAVSANVGASISLLTLAAIVGAVWYFSRR